MDFNKAMENLTTSSTQEQKPQTDTQISKAIQNDKKQDAVNQQAKKKGFFAKLFSSIFATDSKAAKQANNLAQKQQNKGQNFQKQQQNKSQKDNNQRNERNNNNNKNERNKNRNNKVAKPQTAQENKLQKDNNQLNYNNGHNTNNSNDKNERNKNKSNNDKFDKKSNNHNNRSNNLNLNNAEEVIDITKLKYQNQTAVTKTESVKKVISKNPDEFISVMVKDVLENYDSLKDDGATKIATKEKIKTNKYLKFDTVSVDSEIALLNQIAKSNQTVEVEQFSAVAVEESLSVVDKFDDTTIPDVIVEQEKPEKVIKETNRANETKPKKEKQTTTKNNKKEKPAEKETKQNQAKPEYINYSPAIDFKSQALI